MVGKEEVLQILKEHPKWYQKIHLPFGLETPGRDRSRTANHIFPPDLESASVLDIGCAEGFFCFEAKKRNAGRVVGVDIDSDRLSTAIKLSRVLDMDIDIEFLQHTVMDVEELGMFDYVLCLNILHHVTDPIHIIHKLVNMTRKKLVLEIADIRKRIKDIGTKRASKPLLGWWGPLFKSLPSALRPGILVIDSRGKFLITRKWIKNLFQNQYCNIERVELVDSDLPNRYLALVSMRELNTLRIISGPPRVGKSELIHRLESGDGEASRLLDLDLRDGWPVMTGSKLQTRLGEKMNKLVLEYDMCRPILRRYGNYEYDPALTIMRVAAAKTVYILVCPPDVLIARAREVLGRHRHPETKRVRKAERLIFEYSQPGRLRRLYESWISYCKAHVSEVRYLDVSSRQVKVITEHEALKLVSPT